VRLSLTNQQTLSQVKYDACKLAADLLICNLEKNRNILNYQNITVFLSTYLPTKQAGEF